MLNISKQAYVYTIILLLTSLINLLLAGLIYGASGIFIYIFLFIFATPFMILFIYNIDCLTTGGCEVWSWIVSILCSISLIVTTFLGVIYQSTKFPRYKEFI